MLLEIVLRGGGTYLMTGKGLGSTENILALTTVTTLYVKFDICTLNELSV